MKKTTVKRISLAPETIKILSLPTQLATVQGAARTGPSVSCFPSISCFVVCKG
jgi:hypothetical protein